MSDLTLRLSEVNSYVAHKQHLLPESRCNALMEVVGDTVALHATVATSPYLTLWARMATFSRQDLDDALYGRRELVRLLCMRSTLHVVPGHEMPYFFQAYAEPQVRAAYRRAESLLVQAGLCEMAGAGHLLEDLHARVLEVLDDTVASTVEELGQAVPELRVKIRHDVGKPYEGEFSLGSRLVPGMCNLGLLVRARPRGTWRSSLYDYASLSGWLPDVNLKTASPSEARSWLVRRYLGAFGPAAFADIQWWTGFSKGETDRVLRTLGSDLVEVSIAGLGPSYHMLADDALCLGQFPVPDTPHAFLLPGLDPYIMGYHLRNRFLAPEHHKQVFDRAGNAMPTVWLNGCVVGAWGQRKDGAVVYDLFRPAKEGAEALVAEQALRLETFLGGEVLSQRSYTPFARALGNPAQTNT